MIANYHTHTWRCNHAVGQEKEYVENAIAAGLKILGFSDHSPYVFPDGYRSRIRMGIEELPDYVDTVLKLRKEYEGRIEIPLGLEIEYFPALLPQLLPILRDQPMDYLILGQHFVGNGEREHYSGRVADDKTLLERYTNQSIDAMQTGLFTYFAHPDLMHYPDNDAFYVQQARRLCREAKSCGFPLEINLLGIRERKHYPRPLFWEIAAEEGCDVIFGRDAHEPEALLQMEDTQKAIAMVERLGLNLLETVPLRKI